MKIKITLSDEIRQTLEGLRSEITDILAEVEALYTEVQKGEAFIATTSNEISQLETAHYTDEEAVTRRQAKRGQIERAEQVLEGLRREIGAKQESVCYRTQGIRHEIETAFKPVIAELKEQAREALIPIVGENAAYWKANDAKRVRKLSGAINMRLGKDFSVDRAEEGARLQLAFIEQALSAEPDFTGF